MDEGRITEGLRALADAVAGQPTVEEFLSAVSREAVALVGARAAAVSLGDASTLAAIGHSGPAAAPLLSPEPSVADAAGHAMATGEPATASLDASDHGGLSLLSIPVPAADGPPVGALTVADALGRRWAPTEREALQVLASVAASLHRTLVSLHGYREECLQLQHALERRVTIEQAKGYLMRHDGIDAASAFERIRHAARRRNVTARRVAEEVLAGEDQP